eukprot:GDKJ01019603.1.p1 GENE.GDKJ01019603.1~~GDKJ01019603.1.p1  ORF type:complete len:160 (+),score=28.20 GDKJ01019603.1:34-513(+)
MSNQPTTAVDAAKKKGGYHYWHGHGKERALVGDVAPNAVPQKVDGAEIEFDAVASLKKVNITTYSWCDNTKTVSVYVDFKGVGAVDADKINTRYTDKSLRLSIADDGKEHILTIHLSKNIDGSACTHKVKPDQLVFRLVKANEEAWFDLTGAAAAEESD